MALSLKDIVTGKQNKPPRVVCYGVHGIGKSTFASEAPNAIFIQTEDGLDQIDAAKFPRCTTVKQVMDCITLLYTEDHPYQTLVLDTIDWFEKLVHEEVRKTHGASIFTDYGKGYVFSIPYFNELLDGLDALRNKRNMSIILLGHASIKRFDSPETTGYDRYVLDIHDKVAKPVEEWADAVLFANYKVFVTKEDAGFGKQKGKAIGKGDRILYTQERPAYRAKNRYKLPPEITLDYSAFIKLVAEGMAMNSPREEVKQVAVAEVQE